MTVKNIGNCVVFDDGSTQTAFPKGTVMLTSNKASTSVNVKVRGSRKTLLSFTSKSLGYETAEEAINYLTGLI